MSSGREWKRASIDWWHWYSRSSSEPLPHELASHFLKTRKPAARGTTLTAVVVDIVVLYTTAILWMYHTRLALAAMLFAPAWLMIALLHHPATRRRSREAMEDAARFSPFTK